MSNIVERLRADPLRNFDEAANEIERLRAHIAELEAWQQEGQKLFDNYAVGLGTMFGLGKWWGDRPWKQPPFCASCGKHKEYCDGC
jgi:hypothetical protein